MYFVYINFESYNEELNDVLCQKFIEVKCLEMLQLKYDGLLLGGNMKLVIQGS